MIKGFKSNRPSSGGKGGKKDKNRHRINREIDAPEVRVIDEDGKMMGTMSPYEAVQKAEAAGLDLIEIAPTANPPTCRIMDYGKWKYEAQKKEKVAKKKQTVISIKEIQMRPRTDQHDLETKLKHARKFLLGGDKVKMNLLFRGREMAHQELGIKLLQDAAKTLEDIAIVESAPKKEGRQVFVLLAPDAVKIKELESKQKASKKPAEGSSAAAEDGSQTEESVAAQ